MLEKVHFLAVVDLPLALATALAFVLHFNAWARNNEAEITVDLSARLPAARIRVVGLITISVCLCWGANISVWAIFAVLVGIGAVVGDPALLPGVAASAIREWAFGFPQLVLHAPRRVSATPFPSTKSDHPLIGKSGLVSSPLRPCGHIDTEGRIWPAKSEDGRFIETSKAIVVTGIQNGTLLVRLPRVEPQATELPGQDAVNR